MRKLVLAMALVLGFFVVAGRAEQGPRPIGVAAAGTLAGFTLTISDYVINALLDKGDGERLAQDRRALELVDWAGRIVGFGLLGWLAWRRFGRAEAR